MATKITNITVDVATFRKMLTEMVNRGSESTEVTQMVDILYMATEPVAGTKAVISLHFAESLR